MHLFTLLTVVTGCSIGSFAQEIQRTSIDFSQAQEDPNTGELCVFQQVCLANPKALADRLPKEPCPDPNAGQDQERDFAPGCNCNTDSDCGGGTARCVACACQDCPVSTSQSATGVLNPPLTFVIDTTKSVRPDKDSIFNLTQKVVSRIQEIEANIPRYSLITFNDFGPNFNQNVDFRLDTTNVLEFKQEITSLRFESFDGGRDSKERLMQGLLGAVNAADERSLVCVFTDNGSKDLNLRNEIVRLKQQKQITVYIVLTPIFEGFPNDPSLDAYAQVADEVFYISEVGADIFLTSVEVFEETNCV